MKQTFHQFWTDMEEALVKLILFDVSVMLRIGIADGDCVYDVKNKTKQKKHIILFATL